MFLILFFSDSLDQTANIKTTKLRREQKLLILEDGFVIFSLMAGGLLDINTCRTDALLWPNDCLLLTTNLYLYFLVF